MDLKSLRPDSVHRLQAVLPDFMEISQRVTTIQGCSHAKVTPAVRKDGEAVTLGALCH